MRQVILCVANVIGATELRQLREVVAAGRFGDGRATAGAQARLVKRNQQLLAGAGATRAVAAVHDALTAHEIVRAAARPRFVHSILFSRYGVGDAYGAHVDDALMGPSLQRSDVSVTVFLNSPHEYDGGALVIDGPGGTQSFRLEAGQALLYPSTTLHRVEPVTRGARTVAVAWIQSTVRSAEQREVLFDLETTREALFRIHGKTAEVDLITKSAANLLRMWADA